MNGRDRIINIINRRNTDSPGYWKGNPHKDALPLYLEHFSVNSEEELSLLLGDDLRWRHAEQAYNHPLGTPIFDCYLGKEKTSHGQPGVFAECESLKEVDSLSHGPILNILILPNTGKSLRKRMKKGWHSSEVSGAPISI